METSTFYNLIRIGFLPWSSHCGPPSHECFPTPLLLSDFIRGMFIFTVNEQESLPMQTCSVCLILFMDQRMM